MYASVPSPVSLDLIADEEGRQFWHRNHFAEYVHFDVLFRALMESCSWVYNHEPPPKHLATIIKYMLDTNGIEYVKVGQFDIFLKRFGPFKVCLRKAGECVVEEGLLAPWFHGKITRDRAEELLSSGYAGDFLIRFGDSRPDKFSLTRVPVEAVMDQRKRKLEHSLLHNVGEQGYALSSPVKPGEPVFRSLADFVTRNAKVLKRPIISNFSQRFAAEVSGSRYNIQASFLPPVQMPASSPQDWNAYYLPNTASHSRGQSPIDHYSPVPEDNPQMAASLYPGMAGLHISTGTPSRSPSFQHSSHDGGAESPYEPIPDGGFSVMQPSPPHHFGFNSTATFPRQPAPSSFLANENPYGISFDSAPGHFSRQLNTSSSSSLPVLNSFDSGYGVMEDPVPRDPARSPIPTHTPGFDRRFQLPSPSPPQPSVKQTVVETKSLAFELLENGKALYTKSQLSEAAAAFEKAIVQAQKEGIVETEIRALNNLATVHTKQNSLEDAIKQYRMSLEKTRQLINTIQDKVDASSSLPESKTSMDRHREWQKTERDILNNLAIVCRKAGDLVSALDYCQVLRWGLPPGANASFVERLDKRIEIIRQEISKQGTVVDTATSAHTESYSSVH